MGSGGHLLGEPAFQPLLDIPLLTLRDGSFMTGFQCRYLVFSAAQAATCPSAWQMRVPRCRKISKLVQCFEPLLRLSGSQSAQIVHPAAVCAAGKSLSALLTGLPGFCAGGGFGYVSRAYGLACDTIAEVEVVLADGTVVNANANNNSDLLWASQGGLYTTESIDEMSDEVLWGSRHSHHPPTWSPEPVMLGLPA